MKNEKQNQQLLLRQLLYQTFGYEKQNMQQVHEYADRTPTHQPPLTHLP